MKLMTKRMATIAVMAVMTMALIVGAAAVVGGKVTARAQTTQGYFYGQIAEDARAEAFYKAFRALDESGEFKKGAIEYDLIANNVVSADDLAAYINTGDTKVPKAYGAGRDAYLMDHPDLFYVDLFGTSLSVGQMGGGTPVGFLDSSRSLTLYVGALKGAEAVNGAIAAYESKLNEIVTAAREKQSVKEQIEYVNGYIAKNTAYSFGTSVIDGKNVEGPEAAYIDTAYGALVNGKAICGGYAKAFKAAMDRLGIPCVCVQGYARASEAAAWQPHMWNYVEADGMWYAVDVTWNATGNDTNKWLLVGGQKMSDSHIEDGVFSSSGKEFRYPAVKPYDYGVDTDDNGMTIEGTYTDTADSGKHLTLTVSYEGKGAEVLREEGKYLAFRAGYTDADTKEIEWSHWYDSIEYNDVYSGMTVHKATETIVYLHAGFEYMQFALINRAPDDSLGAAYPNEPEYGANAGKPHLYAYNKDNFDEARDCIGMPSIPYLNNGYNSYIPAPGAIGFTPSNTASMKVDKSYDISVTYNESLVLKEGAPAGDIGLEFYASRGNNNVQQYASVSNVTWDGDRTISFTFTPSRMYIHNDALYYFTPANLVGVDSGKVPYPFTYSFKGKNVVCSKVFNDGRLYMSVFGEPLMLDTSDLSVTDFKDENGHYYAESQRSQLLLVANKPDTARQNELDEALKDNVPIADGDVVASTTYEINLQICGSVTKVPNGSYMQVAFGFPEGYSPDDAGTTFKIYHYKHDDAGNITGVEEIPAIITQYGIIAQVKSFSPFTIVQLKNTSEAVTNTDAKFVYATVNGAGGSISTPKKEGKSGIDEVTGNAITYTVAANEGYCIGSIVLNGKAIAASQVKDGKLTLEKDALASSNMLEVTFVTQASAKSYADRGITIVAAGAQPMDLSVPGKSSRVAVVLICVAVIVAVAGVGITMFAVWKRQNAAATVTSQPTRTSTRTAANQPTRTSTRTAANQSTRTSTRNTKK